MSHEHKKSFGQSPEQDPHIDKISNPRALGSDDVSIITDSYTPAFNKQVFCARAKPGSRMG